MNRREPDFENMLKVLRNEVPDRPVLFELYMNMKLHELVNGCKPYGEDAASILRFKVDSFRKLGYDYATDYGSDFAFKWGDYAMGETISLNDGSVIFDEESFDAYQWRDANDADYSRLEKIGTFLPDGMKINVMQPGGVLENVLYLVGYDNLCYMLYDEPELVQRLFDEVGTRLVDYCKNVVQYDSVGVVTVNDDWGFNTQTMLSPEQMRQYVFPWTRKIVDTAHDAGVPVILHSCGNLEMVFEDVLKLGVDAKHSFEDKILPIEDAYEKWHDRIPLLGGFDMDYMCRSSEDEIRKRTAAMMERTKGRGGWAIGTGNSVPEYVPVSNYLAMVETALGYNPLE